MKRIYLILIGLLLSYGSFAIGPITGTTSFCSGSGAWLYDATSGGAWSSNNVGVAYFASSTSGLVTGVSAGTTIVTYTAGASFATTVVVVHPSPDPISVPGSVCTGSTITVTETSSGGVWAMSGPDSVNLTSGVVYGVSAGTAMLTYFIPATGCLTTTTITVKHTPSAITGPSTLCSGSVITLSDGSSGGTWSGTTGVSVGGTGSSASVIGLSAGTALVSYTTSGCSAVAPLTVMVTPSGITGTTSVCTGATTAVADGSAGGTWTTSSSVIATVSGTFGTATITGVSPGTATVFYALSDGCSAIRVVTVNATPASIAGVFSICSGTTTNLTDVSPGGMWTSSSTSIATIGSSGTLTGVSAGTSMISYALAGGCIATQGITINFSPSPITGAGSFCSGLSTTLSDLTSGGTWSVVGAIVSITGSSTTSTVTGITVGAAAGTATVSYTLSGGCMATRVVTVNPIPAPISGTSGICQSSTTNLSDITTGGSWFSGAPGIASIVSTGDVTGVAAGTVIITYLLPTGCGAFSSVTVTPTPAPISGTLNLCPGTSSSLNDDIPGGIWSSSNVSVAVIGSSTGLVYGVSAGTLTIIYTTSCGSISAPAVVHYSPLAITGSSGVCTGATTTLHDVTPAGSWLSSNPGVATIGIGSGTLTGVSTGTATITYLLTTGCMATTLVTVNPTPNPVFGPTNLCLGDTGLLSDALTGGIWTAGNTAIATIGSSSGHITTIALGSTIITYTVAGYCATYSPLYVQPNPSAITGPTHVCAGAAMTVNNSASGGNWSSSSTAIATVGSVSGIVHGILDGTVIITYSLSGCKTWETLTVNPIPAPIAGPANACVGTAVNLIETMPGGAWSSSNGAVATVSSGLLAGVSVGTANISYILSATGCFAVKTETVNPMPSAIYGPSAVCTGANIILTDGVSGGTWSGSSVVAVGSATGVISGLLAGTAAITYTIGGSCSANAVLTVNSVSAIAGLAYLCTGSTGTYNALIAGGVWSAAGSTISINAASGDVTPLSSGGAIITYTLPTGCVSTKSVYVFNGPGSIYGGTNICAGTGTINLHDATIGGSWHSGNSAIALVGSGSGVVTGVAAGTVTMSYTLSSGCSSTEVLYVNPLPGLISGSSNGCIGAPTTLTDTSAGGVWSTTGGVASISSSTGLLTGISAGTTIVTFTLPTTGCFRTMPVTINHLPAYISGPSLLCSGTTVSLSDATGGGSWVSGNTAIAAIGTSAGSVIGLSAGPVAISYVLSTGCAITKTLTVKAAPGAITGSANLCLLATDTLADGSAGGIWTTSGSVASVGSSSGVVSGAAPGTANITYTLSDGCFVSRPVTVNPLPTLLTVTGGGSYCSDDTGLHVVLDGSFVGINYELMMGTSVMRTLSGTGSALDFGLYLVPGMYTVTAMNPATGCMKSMLSGASITVNPVPLTDTINGGGSYCSGGPGVPIGLSHSSYGVRYQLLDGLWAVGAPIRGTNSALDFGLDTSAGLYTVIATDTLSGCHSSMYGSASISVIPSVIPSVGLSANPGDVVCIGTPVAFTTTPTGGGISPVYRWYVNGLLVSSDTTAYSYVPDNGDVVTFGLTSSAACAAPSDTLDRLTMTVNPYPAAITGPSAICVQQTSSLDEVMTGGTWSSSDPGVAITATVGISTGGIIGISAGTTVITYMPVTGCFTTTMLTVNPLPVISAFSSEAACGGKYDLTASGGISYYWSASGLSCSSCASTRLIPAANEHILVTGTDARGCSDIAGVFITGNRISGHVSFSGPAPASSDMMVWLTRYATTDSTVISVDSMVTCSDAGMPYYEFNGIPNGDYFVRATLLTGNTPGLSTYIPTYGSSSTYWSSASGVAHSGGFDSLHIKMNYGTVPSGQGSISGVIYAETGSVSVVSIPGMLVYLVDPATNNVITYEYTDSSGAYSFNNLANGNYIIYPENYNYYTTPSSNISLTTAGEKVNGVDFIRYSVARIIVPYVTNGVKAMANDDKIVLYPNPSSGIVNIQWNGRAPGNAEIVITDVLGREVFKSVLQISMPNGKQAIDLSRLDNGIYMVSINTDDVHFVSKLQVEK